MPYFYGRGLDGNDPLLSCCLYFIFVLYSFGVPLGDDRSLLCGGDDMRSLVVIGGLCVGVIRTHICF